MLDELLKEIDELKSYKSKYEGAVAEKKRMSDLLYDYMLKEYEGMSMEDRIKKHKEEYCNHCRYRDICEDNISKLLPEDIFKPFRSEIGWIPSWKACKRFEWS